MPFKVAKPQTFVVKSGFVKFTDIRDKLRELGSAVVLVYGIDFNFDSVTLKKWKSEKMEKVLFLNFLPESEFVTGKLRTIFSEWHEENAPEGDIKLYLEYFPATIDVPEKVRMVLYSDNAEDDTEAMLIHVHDMQTPTNSKWSTGAEYSKCFTYIPKDKKDGETAEASQNA